MPGAAWRKVRWNTVKEYARGRPWRPNRSQSLKGLRSRNVERPLQLPRQLILTGTGRLRLDDLPKSVNGTSDKGAGAESCAKQPGYSATGSQEAPAGRIVCCDLLGARPKGAAVLIERHSLLDDAAGSRTCEPTIARVSGCARQAVRNSARGCAAC